MVGMDETHSTTLLPKKDQADPSLLYKKTKSSTVKMAPKISEKDQVAHDRLRKHPVLGAPEGVAHTRLPAGIVVGWASLLPLLRKEGVDLTASEFASVFTHGAIGNYLSSLPFGFLLDRTGPKTCGIISSILFGVGVFLCSLLKHNTLFLDAGFTLLGFVSGLQTHQCLVSLCEN